MLLKYCSYCWVEFNEELFDREEKRARESQKLAIGLAKESFSFIQDLNQIASQQEFERLQSDKDKGIITEEQYQKKLKELKLKQAKENKEIAIFNASLAFGEALLNALTFKPANAVPAAHDDSVHERNSRLLVMKNLTA